MESDFCGDGPVEPDRPGDGIADVAAVEVEVALTESDRLEVEV